ncbi:MAG: T9SS type A sorting domain-containing protein [Flavobacteriales bacterium]|nr:T9SS type A sorting domain-containing protein [Flavobacteriales bacterium]
MLRPTIALLGLLFAVQAFGQTSSQAAAVQLSATVQSSPAGITLSWNALSGTTSITIHRKLVSATSWGVAIATPAATATTYQDNAVTVGTAYEYRVVRVAAGVTGQGYICSGIQVPLADFRGKIVLVVDNTFTSALANELTQLTNDLRSDGWVVLRSDVSRTASVTSVRNTIMSHYNADPANVKAVFLVGHVPVPYSGNIAPDGHSEHQGAWPCDGYYGEMNGTWTDNTVNNNTSQRVENRNIPGDGRFDQSSFPSALELQVGRVDFFDMPAFALNETELLRAYLVKLHGYKVNQWAPLPRGIVFDNLQWVANPLAGSAWRNIPPMVGAAQVAQPNVYAGAFNTLINNQSYLWTYYSGGGLQAYEGSTLTYNGADLAGSTQHYAAMSAGGAFNMSCGSYFGDWDNKNNFLRAPLASGSGLTSCWAGIPGWYFHHMGLGENIGLGTLLTMNNTALYTPLNDGWQGSGLGRTHLALMGDPTLRLKMIAPPANLIVTNVAGNASFTWTAAPGSVDGYHLYRFNASNGTITRLTTTPVTGTSFTSATVPFSAGTEYMVRAVKLQVDPAGSYLNLSLGAIATSSGSASPAVDCHGAVGGTALPGTPCNDGNACTTNDTWNASCQCVGTSISPVASLTAGGPTTFCSGGHVVLNASTGSGYTYVWRRNGTTISGAAASSYTATQAGSYTVTISNGTCPTTSAAISVSVGTMPAVALTSVGSTSFCTGGSVVLNASTGSGYAYAWQRNGTTITGATASSYTATQAGSYAVTVSNAGCSATTSAITVTVHTLPAATCTSNASNATVNVAVTGGMAPYAYSWNTSPVQATATATVSASGSYVATVTDARGCVAACTASITLPATASCNGIRTETQAVWGGTASGTNPAAYLVANFAAAFPPPGYLQIGCGSRKLRLTTASAVLAFLPSNGSVARLPYGTLQNPGTSYSNKFAGELVALKLSVRFDEMTASFSPATVLLKNMVIASGTYAGWTVQQLISAADAAIGSCNSSYSRSALHTALAAVNNGYQGGAMNSGYLVCPGASGMVETGTGEDASNIDEEALPVVADTDTEKEGLVVSVFPNPVSSAATFVIVGAVEEGNTTLELYSANGLAVGRSVIGSATAAELRYNWDARSLAPGIYFYKVLNGDQIATGRVVVQ